jgi:hypothetical protein
MWQDEPATLKQRMALFNMYQRCGWDTDGIRDMTKGQASAAFEKAKKENDKITYQLEAEDVNG